MPVISRRSSTERRRTNRGDHHRRGSWGTRKVAGADAINVLARIGFIARGIIYVIIGVIALMLALGAAKHTPDRAGAVEAIAGKPFGFLLLWILTIGFAALALWRLVQALTERLEPTLIRRLKAFGSAVGYAIAAFTTFMFVQHGRVPTSSDTASRDITATVLSHDGGQFIVLFAGLLIAATGIYMVVQAFNLDFTEYLRMGWMNRRTREIVVLLGRVGYAARGIIVALIGVALVDAAAAYNAAKAEGVDGVLRRIADAPFGPVLLILVALGLIAFGLVSFFEAEWRRTYGGVPR